MLLLAGLGGEAMMFSTVCSYIPTCNTVLDISASIMQGSAIGPASYVVNAADLTTVTPGYAMLKYAADTYLNLNLKSSIIKNITRR